MKQYTDQEQKAIEIFREHLSYMVDEANKIAYSDYHFLYAMYSEMENGFVESLECDEDEDIRKKAEICEDVCFSDIEDAFYIEKESHYTCGGDTQLDTFIIEVTRKCNIKCKHCLRGKARRDTLDLELLRKFLQNAEIGHIGDITLGGGENGCDEGLSSKVMRYLVGLQNVGYSSGYVVLNGAKEYGEEFIKSLQQFQNSSTDSDEGANGSAAFSYDHFHTQVMTAKQIDNRESNYYKLKQFGLNVSKHTDDGTYKGSGGLICMGRSTTGRELEPSSIESASLYFTYDGLLFSDCNLSYDEMDKVEDSKFFICDTRDITSAEDLQEAFDKYDAKLNQE